MYGELNAVRHTILATRLALALIDVCAVRQAGL